RARGQLRRRRLDAGVLALQRGRGRPQPRPPARLADGEQPVRRDAAGGCALGQLPLLRHLMVRFAGAQLLRAGHLEAGRLGAVAAHPADASCATSAARRAWPRRPYTVPRFLPTQGAYHARSVAMSRSMSPLVWNGAPMPMMRSG